MQRASSEDIQTAAADIFAGKHPIQDGHVSIHIQGWEGETATVQVITFNREGELCGIAEQGIQLGKIVAPIARFQLFFEGARKAIDTVHRRYGELYPAELLPVALLACDLHSADEFHNAIADPDVRARLVSPSWTRAFEAEHGLPALTDPTLITLLWWLAEDDVLRWFTVAKELVQRDATAAIPHLICRLEAMANTMDEHGSYVFTNDNRNAVVVLALALEPLLNKASNPEHRERLARLRDKGLFDLGLSEWTRYKPSP